MVPALL